MKQHVVSRVLVDGALVVASLLASLIAAEALLRLTDYRYALVSVAVPPGYFISDPEVGAIQVRNRPPAEFRFGGPPFATFTNSLGCFDYERAINPGYVLVIGDSATWGYVPVEDNWATRLERLIGRQVVKCGVTGVGTRFQSALLRRLVGQIGVPPAAVILLYTKNDLNDDVVFPSYRVIDGQRLDSFRSLDLATGELRRYSDVELAAALVEYHAKRASLRQWLRSHSIVALLLYRAVFRRQDNPTPDRIHERYEVELWDVDPADRPWLTAARESHVATLLALNDRVRQMGASFIVFDHDEGAHQEVLAARLSGTVDLYHQIDVDDARKAGSERFFYRFDDHWNVEGNRMAAEEMFRALSAVALQVRSSAGTTSQPLLQCHPAAENSDSRTRNCGRWSSPPQ